MTSLHDVETHLNTALITRAALKERVIHVADFFERVQTPATALPDQAKDRSDIVRKHCGAEPRAIDQTRSVEDVVFLNLKLIRTLGFRQVI